MRKKRDVDYGYDGGGRQRQRDIEQQAFFSPFRSSSLSGTDRIPIPKEGDARELLHEDWCEAGPSRITIDDLERMEREKDEENKRTRKRYPTGLGALAAFVSATVLLPVAHAAPPPPLRQQQQQRQRRSSSRTLPPKPTRTLLQPNPREVTPTTAPQPESLLNDEPIEYDIKYLTSMSTPTHALPTDVYVVDEQRLPFYMTRNEDGEWTKVDNAWFLYGRQAGDVSTANFGPGDDPSATAQTTSAPTGTSQFAITDNLPPGWGIEATRSNFYITPLIVAMSVILALMIVAGIIFIVIKRRKEHRRAKRRAARLRRKALAAAGLTEEDVKNDAQTGGAAGGIDAGLREKLTEIDKIVKKPRKEKERGPTAMIRTKVRSWNQGVLRRRKGGAAGAAGSLGPSRSATPSIEVISETDTAKEVHRGSSDTTRTTTTRTTPTVASHSSHERGAGGTSGSGSGEATTSDSNTGEMPSSTELSRAITQPTPAAGNGATYFPPAYRPASVRSLQMQPTSSTAGGSARGASSSSPSSGEEHLAPPPTATEKTNAPGYYPAPATADAEEALAVASRSDGKQRMDAPPPPSPEDEAEENRIRHIATDDKRVLERMRMGASAPPQASAAAVGHGGEEGGPSAPTVEVDEQGFERHHHSPDPVETQEDGEGTGSASGSALPRPPPQRPTLSYRLYSQDDLATSLGIDTDERHLLPSAPPPPAHPDHLAPSAPPMLDEGGEGDTAVSAPSAPTFEIGEDDDADDSTDHAQGHEHSHSESGIDGGDEYARTDTNDTRDLTPTPPRSSSPIPNPNQPRNPSLPTYEP